MFQFAVMGFSEMWPILIVVLLLFGASNLPKLARSMGSSVNEFKKGMQEGLPEEKDPKSSESDKKGN